MQKIVTHLWFAEKAEEAVAFYASLIPDSRVDNVMDVPVETPSGPAGSVQVVDFTLGGQKFQALNAGPLNPFNHAISLIIHCDSQEEIDKLWDGLSEGGELEQCGWLKDKYGLSWQITPTVFEEMMHDRDPERVRRVTEAMLKMQKLDIAELQAAFEGKQLVH